MRNPFGWHYPPGVTESMIPGNRPQDAAWERLLESVPETCPKCGHGTQGDGEYGLAEHVTADADHEALILCQWEDAEGEPCEETLAYETCGCSWCDPAIP